MGRTGTKRSTARSRAIGTAILGLVAIAAFSGPAPAGATGTTAPVSAHQALVNRTCGSDYGIFRQHRLDDGGTVLVALKRYANGAPRTACAVHKLGPVRLATGSAYPVRGVRINNETGAVDLDKGRYASFAGPVYVPASTSNKPSVRIWDPDGRTNWDLVS